MPVVTLDGAVSLARARQAQGRVVVFTNGVFDLLHPGHLRYLRQARAEGDVLMVGINSDRSVRENKGPFRPILPASERAEVVAALADVDAALVFDEDTPERVIGLIRPDVLVKGADWPLDRIVGREAVLSKGGRVVRAELSSGYSTTRLVEKVAALAKGTVR